IAAAGRRATALLRAAEQQAEEIVDEARAMALALVEDARTGVASAITFRYDDVLGVLADSHAAIMTLLDEARRELQLLTVDPQARAPEQAVEAPVADRLSDFRRSSQLAAERAASERFEAQAQILHRRARPRPSR